MALSVLFACGKIEKQEFKSEPIGGAEAQAKTGVPDAKLVQTEAQLPKCAAENEGQLVYVQQYAAFAACTSAKWTRVSVDANDGINSAIYCQMMVPQATLLESGLDKAPAEGMNFFYSATQFVNATRFVQVRISSGAQSLTSAAFWHNQQEGYSKMMSQDIVWDMTGADDFGLWFFTADAELTGDANNPYAIVYSDPKLDGARLLAFDAEKDCVLSQPKAQ